MGMTRDYATTEPRREDVDALAGATLLEFGSPWCGHCRIAQPLLEAALSSHPEVRHVKIEDASGRVVLRDGRELARVVRPREAASIARALGLVTAP